MWEDSSALLLSYARFSDGSIMDVTDKAVVSAGAPASADAALPFSLSTDNTTGLPWLTVSAKVSISLLHSRCLCKLEVSVINLGSTGFCLPTVSTLLSQTVTSCILLCSPPTRCQCWQLYIQRAVAAFAW